MKKETIICIVVVVAIIIGNVITQKYTKESVESLTGDLENEKLKEDAEKTNENFEARHDKLAYYIEHNELEKVEDSLTGLQSLIETKEYGEAIKELDKTVFLLEHIEEKYAFNLENIF